MTAKQWKITSAICVILSIYLFVYDYIKKPDVMLEDIARQENVSKAERNAVALDEANYHFKLKRDLCVVIICVLASSMCIIKLKSLDKEEKLKVSEEKLKESKARLKESEEKMNTYASDIEEKENSLKTIKKKMRSMQAEMATIRDKHFAVLAHGKNLYEDIIGGGNSLKWRKADFEAFVEHYRTVDEALVSQIESTYSGLTPNNKFVLILQRIIGNDDDIRRITGMTQSSIRTMRHRISRKKNATAGRMEAAACL